MDNFFMQNSVNILFIQYNIPPMSIHHLSPGLLYVMNLISKIEKVNVFFKTLYWENLTTNNVLKFINSTESKILALPVFSDGHLRIESIIKNLTKKHNIPVVVGGPHIEAIKEGFLSGLKGIYRSYADSTDDIINTFINAILNSTKLSPSYPHELKKKHLLNIDEMGYPFLQQLEDCNWKNYRPVIITSFGCKYNCVFCSEGNKYHKIIYRKKEIIEKELDWIGKYSNFRYVMVADDNSISSKVHIKQLMIIFKKIVHKYPDLHFFLLAHPRDIVKNKDIVMKFLDLNIIRVQIGIESGCQIMRRRLGKSIPDETIIESVKYLNQAKLPFIIGSFIIGGPNEDIQSLKKTYSLIKKLIELSPGSFEPVFSFLRPYPGTAIMDRSNNELKNIDGINIGNTITDYPILTTPALSEEKLFTSRIKMSTLIENLVIKQADKVEFDFWLKKYNYEKQFNFDSVWTQVYLNAPNCKSALEISINNNFHNINKLTYQQALNYYPICTISIPPTYYNKSSMNVPYGRNRIIKIPQRYLKILSLCNGERKLIQVLSDFEKRYPKEVKKTTISLWQYLKKLSSGKLLLWGKI